MPGKPDPVSFRQADRRTVSWARAALRRVPSTSFVLLLADALATVTAFYLGTGLRFVFDFDAIARFVGPLPLRATAFTLGVVLGLLSMGLYRPRQRPTASDTAVRTLLGVTLGVVLAAVLFYVVPDLSFGRGGMALAFLITCILVFAMRTGLLHLIDFNPIKRKVLVLGCGDTAVKIRQLRRRADRRRFEVLAFVALGNGDRRRAAELDIVPVVDLAEAHELVAQADEIVVAVDDRRGMLPLEFLLRQKQRGLPVTDIVDFLERETERLDLDILRPSWLLYEKSSQTDVLYRWLKRCFDLVFGLALMVVTLPLLVLVTVAILIEDGPSRPILYRQQRVGRNGRPFQLLKFRSMRPDAEQDGPVWARANDDRVTRVGRLIRRFRIDELPQMLNVIKGDMSVVGPRPERPEFVERLSREVPLYFYRHGVRPGLTGWAQLNFPYGSSVEDAREKLKYDLYYIKNANVIMDLLILLQTAEVVVWGRGTSMAGSSERRRGSGPADGQDQDQDQDQIGILGAAEQDSAR
jgi:sugar transferase (PEP-CTERM system associated)